MRELLWLLPAFFVIALLYASVGHGGGSGYLAVLSLLGLPAAQMATTALLLNVCVAGIGTFIFWRAGHFSGRLIWPFALASVPAAFLGGRMHVSSGVYAVLLAMSLAVAAWRLLAAVPGVRAPRAQPPLPALAIPLGGAIGWLSGVVGVGGGIFLSPLLLLAGWAGPQQTAAASACFILVNSVAGLAGRLTSRSLAIGDVWPLWLAACIGGIVGARLGANQFSGQTLKRLLAVILLIVAAKLLISQGV